MPQPSAHPDAVSIWDRLAESRDGDAGRGSRSGAPLSEIKHAVCRDLESLLNTRRRVATFHDAVIAEDQLCPSLVTYGIPDFTGAQMGAREERERFRREVQRAIREFEPRIHHVHVEELDSEAMARDRTMRFRITGVIRSPSRAAGGFTRGRREEAVFETRIETTTCAVAVERAR